LKKTKLLIQIYVIFFKIGAFTFGGGYAMIPFIKREFTEVRKHITEEEMTDIIVISQSMPGAVSINAATAIGFRIAGVKGAIISTIGIVTPSLLIIIIIASFFINIQNNEFATRALYGIRSGIIAIIFMAFIDIFKKGVKNKLQYFIFSIVVIASLVLNIFPPYLIIFGGIFSILAKKIKEV
jgi:chromate transporter